MVGIILLFVGTCIIPSTAQDIEKSQSTSRGNWLYVGGSGPGNYTRIRDAINDAQDGDTIFVYDDSSPYAESFWIDKSIQLIGENKITTILNATGQTNIHVWAPQVLITGFTLLNRHEDYDSYGVDAFDSEYLTFKNNIVIGCDYGLQLSYFSNCTIENNEIRDGTVGIDAYHIFTSTFASNTFIDNKCGIELNNARNNLLSNNTFTNNGMSLVDYAYPNTFIGNTVNGKALLYLENESDMIIDNEPIGQILLVGCNYIKIKNLDLSNVTVGIEFINTNNCLLTNTTIQFNQYVGILFLEVCHNNIISDNRINFNGNGIVVESYFTFAFNRIIGNSVRFNSYGGIYLNGAGNIVKYNVIENNSEGIFIIGGVLNLISKNVIRNNSQIGLEIAFSGLNLIKSNNIMQNKRNVLFEMMLGTVFFRNYWKPYLGFGPKAIWGLQWIIVGFDPRQGFPILLPIPWVKFDWLPARHPYDIGV